MLCDNLRFCTTILKPRGPSRRPWNEPPSLAASHETLPFVAVQESKAPSHHFNRKPCEKYILCKSRSTKQSDPKMVFRHFGFAQRQCSYSVLCFLVDDPHNKLGINTQSPTRIGINSSNSLETMESSSSGSKCRNGNQ